MAAHDTEPTQPLPEWAQSSAEPRRRHRAWPWVVALVIVAALAVAAWFGGEWIARDIVTKTIRDQVITQLSLPADQEVDVDVKGAVVPQLISGSLDDVTVSSDDVVLEEFAGDVTVRAQDVAIRGEASVGTISATVVLDQQQLQTLLSTVENFPVDTLGLAEPDVTITTELSVFGVAVPIGIGLTPSAVDGDIVLTPASLQLGGAEITAAALTEQFGDLTDVVLRDWTICIAQYIPAGVEVTGVSVNGDRVVADLGIDSAIVGDAALQEVGTCD